MIDILAKSPRLLYRSGDEQPNTEIHKVCAYFFLQLCGLVCESNMIYQLLKKKQKRVVLKGLSRYDAIHSVWSIRATPVLLAKSKHSQSDNGVNTNHHS